MCGVSLINKVVRMGCGCFSRERRISDDSSGNPEVLTWEQKLQRMEVKDENDPGIAIFWADDAQLHNCLGVPGAPIAQGVNPAASANAIRNWFSEIVTAVAPGAPATELDEDAVSSEFFHHMHLTEYTQILNTLLDFPITLAWGGNLWAENLSVGKFFLVTATGRGSNEATQIRCAPFYG